MRAAVLVVGVLVIVLLVAGCGGGSNDSTAGGEAAAGDGAVADENAPPMTKVAFIKRGDEICLAANNGIQTELGAGKDLISATVAALQTDVDEISALGTPTGDEAQVEAILNTTLQTIAAAENSKSITNANDLLAKAEKLSDRYGFKKCLLGN